MLYYTCYICITTLSQQSMPSGISHTISRSGTPGSAPGRRLPSTTTTTTTTNNDNNDNYYYYCYYYYYYCHYDYYYY